MDHGTLTDNNGRKADFRNVVVVMTTNAGVQETTRKSIGFSEQDHTHDAMGEINKVISPEFRNRLDNTCHRTCAHCFVIAFVSQPLTCFRGKLKVN